MYKYSIIMPYYKRSGSLYNTLISFNHHYKNRKDYEVIIVEDIKNYNDKKQHEKLKFVIASFDKKIKIIHIKSNFENCYNPAPLFNLGFKKSNGKFIVITNPECFHKSNILFGFDEIYKTFNNCYIVCGCKNVETNNYFIKNFHELEYKFHSWYQHIAYRNEMFHFCSCISKENYLKIGGFDENYKYGVCYDDNDLVETIRRNNIEIYLADELEVLHLAHKNSINIDNFDDLLLINRNYFNSKKSKNIDNFGYKFLISPEAREKYYGK